MATNSAPLPSGVFARRIARLRKKLEASPADVFWIRQPENRRYLSGFEASDGGILESSGYLLIHEDRLLLATDPRYGQEAETQASDYEVRVISKKFLEAFPELLQELGAETVGFEPDYVTWGLHKDLSEKLEGESPGIRLSPLEGEVEDLRIVKDLQEVRLLQTAADLMSEVLEAVIEGLRPGMSERDVAWDIQDRLRRTAAEDVAFAPIVASGPNSALPHAVPTDRRLQEGEPILLDVGARYQGYCSDMTRTVFLGRPDSEFQEIYAVVRRAQEAGMAAVRPGVSSDVPDNAARAVIQQAGFEDAIAHSLGHGVGLAVHEAPKLSRLSPSPLTEGMVVTVEPGIYLPGKGGVRLEETVLIESEGVRVLTREPHRYAF